MKVKVLSKLINKVKFLFGKNGINGNFNVNGIFVNDFF